MPDQFEPGKRGFMPREGFSRKPEQYQSITEVAYLASLEANACEKLPGTIQCHL
jgi:hypothetical protein